VIKEQNRFMDLMELTAPNERSPRWILDLDQVVAANLITNVNGSVQLVLFIGTHELEFTDDQARAIWQRLQARGGTSQAAGSTSRVGGVAVYGAAPMDRASS
jgi:hypothetical protein